jgi:hypothetical protein
LIGRKTRAIGKARIRRTEGHVENLLPAVGEATEHRVALPRRDMPTFMVKLRSADGNLARLMEFIVLTGVRASKASGAQWVKSIRRQR